MTDRIPSEQVIQALDERLFQGATFADLNPAKPILLLNSTDALTGDPLVISDEQFAQLGVPLAPFSIARAVYMSAAYPGVLEPLAISNGESGHNGAAAPPVLAYDGGAADNLGIRTLVQVVEEALSERPMADRFPQGCLVISIDATGRQKNEARKPLSAAAALLRGHRRNVLELAGIPAARQDMAMFGTFRVGQDGTGGSCRFWHVALRQLPDSDPVQGEAVLAQIARELVAIMQRDVKTDWRVRDDVRAKLRSSIKRLLVKYHYPPDRQPDAIRLVIEQMEAMAPRYAS